MMALLMDYWPQAAWIALLLLGLWGNNAIVANRSRLKGRAEVVREYYHLRHGGRP